MVGMRQGFFSSRYMVKEEEMPKTPLCGKCGLYKHCISPKMKPTGKGERRVLIVAEAPGKNEDEQGKQLVGNSGQYLMDLLLRFGVNMRRDCWLTNAIICRPEDNRTPDDKEIQYCRPNLFNTIQELQPEIIIPLGGTAVKSLIGGIWKEDIGAIGRWVGWQIPCQKPNAWICPTYHPAFLLRGKDPMTEMYMTHHLKEAFKLSGRPWKKVPDWKSKVHIEYDPNHAARLLLEWSKGAVDLAFDYETNCLKPDDLYARIVSCSVCFDGKHTMAFPWRGEVIQQMSELLRGPLNKIASNLKFEERWTRAVLGHPVRNWHWDTILAAHIEDNRPDITGLKFQSFVRLGFESYDQHIKPYLKAKGNTKVNTIDKCDMKELLLYNGLDSLLEYKLYQKQKVFYKATGNQDQ